MSDLARVLMDLDRAIAAAAPAEVPGLALALSARLAALAARGMDRISASAAGGAQVGGLLTVKEAADRLRVTTEWIYRRSKRLPFTVRVGARGLRVSERKLEAWIREKSARVY